MKQILPLFTLALLCSACNHVTTKVPGVLDLRSDGSGATAAKEAPKASPEMMREGFSGIMYGDGLAGTADVTIVDRKYWVLGLVPILNESATEEIQAALGDGAMRNVKIGDSETGTDIIMSIVVRAIPVVNVLGLIMPPFDVTVSGTRIDTAGGAGLVEPPPPTGAPSPAPPAVDPNAPSTTPGT